MVSFQNWKAVRPEALNLAPQQTQQTKFIYLAVLDVKGWIKYFLRKSTGCGLIVEKIECVYNFVEAFNFPIPPSFHHENTLQCSLRGVV